MTKPISGFRELRTAVKLRKDFSPSKIRRGAKKIRKRGK